MKNHFDDPLHFGKDYNVGLTEKDLLIICRFFSRIENVLSFMLSSKVHESDSQANSWSYIPYFNKGFLDALDIIKDKNQKAFLDVGCGFGLKCWLAKQHFKKVTGIDISKKYIGFANKILQDTKIELQSVNASKFEHYKDYDVIYAYDPIRKKEKVLNLYGKIGEQMKKGSHFIIASCHHFELEGFENVWRNGYACVRLKTKD